MLGYSGRGLVYTERARKRKRERDPYIYIDRQREREREREREERRETDIYIYNRQIDTERDRERERQLCIQAAHLHAHEGICACPLKNMCKCPRSPVFFPLGSTRSVVSETATEKGSIGLLKVCTHLAIS